MEQKERYSLVKALFSIAASDGSVDESESEEIRVICMSLRLQHQDFISARASVLDKIRALKRPLNLLLKVLTSFFPPILKRKMVLFII